MKSIAGSFPNSTAGIAVLSDPSIPAEGSFCSAGYVTDVGRPGHSQTGEDQQRNDSKCMDECSEHLVQDDVMGSACEP
jgi:hypothetical protein